MKYNNSQIEAIQHVDGPMLVLAGPGSGKTAVITQRTYNLIHKHNIEPSSILVITFTKAAANEMKNRFLAMSQADTTRVTFGTFHAIFFMVLKYAYGMSSSNIISEEQRYGIMRDILSYHRLEYKDENEFIGNLLGEIGKIKNSRIDINNFYSSQKYIRNASPYMTEEEKRLEENLKDKKNWIDKRGFFSSVGHYSVQPHFISNYVQLTPSESPLNHKFRDVEKKKWITQKGFC